MQSNQFQYSCMCRLNVVWRLHSAISGKAYRFHGGNYCTHNDLQTRSRECQFLQDNDMTTCELVPNGARVMFGLFVKEPRRRSIFVSVYGKGILCNPVYGISLTIISTDRESHACKAYFTESAHSCTHECRCPQDKPCSHMTIVIYPKAFADGVTEICEIKIWTGSSGTSIISAKYLVIIWSMQIRMSEVFDVDLNSMYLSRRQVARIRLSMSQGIGTWFVFFVSFYVVLVDFVQSPTSAIIRCLCACVGTPENVGVENMSCWSVNSFNFTRKIFSSAKSNELIDQQDTFCFNHASAFYTSNNIMRNVDEYRI